MTVSNVKTTTIL